MFYLTSSAIQEHKDGGWLQVFMPLEGFGEKK
jgi:hypothetical protein